MILAWLQARAVQLIAAAVFAVVLWGWGYGIGHGRAERVHLAELAAKTENAMLNSRASALRQSNIDGVQRANDAATERELLTLVDSLRNRPERVSRTAATTCTAATGLDLARPDSEFLARYSAERQRFRSEVIACRESEDNLRALLESANKK